MAATKTDPRISIIADWLEKQATDSAITDETIWDKLRIPKSTFYRIKPKAAELLNERLANRARAVEDTKTEAAIMQAQKGIKTREERLWDLQLDLDRISEQLKTGKDKRYISKDGKIESIDVDIDLQTSAYLHRTAKELRAEISKIEGDYAPEKRQITFPAPVVIQTGGESMRLRYKRMPLVMLRSLYELAKERGPRPADAPPSMDLIDLIDEFEILAEMCHQSLEEFVKAFWHVIIAEDMVWEPHMSALCQECQRVFERVFLRPDPNDPETDPEKKKQIRLEKLQDLIINIPPGTTKSTITTIMAPAWAWIRDPSVRIITGSYSKTLAKEHSQKSRDIIASDLYRRLFPQVVIKLDKDQKDNYETTANGQRFACSVGSSATGVHAHIIIVDDPLSPEQAASQPDIKRANRWLDKTLSLRKIDKKVTVRILIMQRLAVNDPTGTALEKKKENSRWICLPGELSEHTSPEYRHIYQDGLLSPLRLGRKELAEAQRDLGSAGYAGQIQQRPTPEGGTTWQESWFILVPDEHMPAIDKLEAVQNDWDLAYTKDEKNAASAYIKTGILANRIYITDLDWKWVEFPALIKWMKSIDFPHYIEAKASGKSAKQTLRKNGIAAIEVNVNKDKIARAKDATPVAESGIVYIRKSLADRFFNDSKQGILFFPNGEFQDLADCLSQMLVRRTKKGRIVSSGTQSPQESTESVDELRKENPLQWLDEN